MENEQRYPVELLERARQEIDETDKQLINLLARRFEAVKQVAKAKINHDGKPLLDLEREKSVLARWMQDAEARELSVPFVKCILKEILNHSRRLQEPLLNGHADTQKIRVGYQGIPGSYSSLASARLMATRASSSSELVGYPTFQDVVDALQDGKVDYAFLPVENSIGGSIHDVNRLICEQTLHIVDEETWEVDHVLAAPQGVVLEDVRTIRSHPAALLQCETFLKGIEGVERQQWFDTAGAAESLAQAEGGEIAVICSEEAAHLHGLNVLARGIADKDQNKTRFLLLSRQQEIPDARIACKTSLLFRLNHHEGALARALAALAKSGINLTRIESRPISDMPWEYHFFVDVEGHIESTGLAEALRQLRDSCNHLRVLGCYPSRTLRLNYHLVTQQSTAAHGPATPGVDYREISAAEPPKPCAAPAESQAAAPALPKRICVYIGSVPVGEGHFTLMAGPCAVESREQILAAGRMVRSAGATVLRGGAFKPRTSPYAFQGLGLEGLEYLRAAGDDSGLPVVTEVLTVSDIPLVASRADALQVGARNMHNFALLKELGYLDKPILLKRGMSATVKELILAAEYILAGGNQQVILCERGIRTFEPSTRSTLDLSAVPVIKSMTGLPVIVDPSHAAGKRELVIPLALAAAAAGADGLIVEAHPRPEEALCDKEQALTEGDLHLLVDRLRPIVASQERLW